jgi:hypothetical protein
MQFGPLIRSRAPHNYHFCSTGVKRGISTACPVRVTAEASFMHALSHFAVGSMVARFV